MATSAAGVAHRRFSPALVFAIAVCWEEVVAADQSSGSNDSFLGKVDQQSDRLFALAVAALACGLVGCVCIAMFFPQTCSRRRPEEDKKRKEKRIVTTEEILEKLPPVKTPRASEGQQPSCVVCLEEVDVDEESITTQCGHTFHKDCVIQWWTHKPRRSIRCPMCRKKQKIRNKARKDTGEPADSPRPQDALSENEDEDEQVESGQAPNAVGLRQQHSWLPELPDLEVGNPALELPGASPFSSRTARTMPSVADEATPMSEISSLPVRAAEESDCDLEATESI
jgi:hypothetical protein